MAADALVRLFQDLGTINNSGAYTDIGWGRISATDPTRTCGSTLTANAPYDPTHQLKVQGSYILPFDIRLNVYFQAISGDTWTPAIRTEVYGTGGRVTFFAEQRGSNRYPMEKILDMRLEKIFTLAQKYQLGADDRLFQHLQ